MKSDELSPRHLANATAQRTLQGTVWAIGACTALVFCLIFLEDVRWLRNAEWPKGWPISEPPIRHQLLPASTASFSA